MHVQPPAHAQRGERQQHGERGARERRDGTDLDEARLAHRAAWMPSRDRPRRVGVQAVRGLCEREREALAQEQEAVEEAARQLHVVVDHAAASRGPRRGGSASSRLRFSNLPSVPGAHVCSSTLVARALELRARSHLRARVARDARRSGRARACGAARRARRARGAARRPLSSSPRVERLVGGGATDARRGRRRCRSCPTGSRRRGASAWSRIARDAFAQPLAQAPRAVSDHRQPRGAAPAHDVPERSRRASPARARATAPARDARRSGARRDRARGRRAQSARRRASAPARRCSTAAPATYRTRAAGFCARRRSCHSCSSPPCSSETSNGPTRSKRAAADRHVGAPREARVDVALAEVERGDGRVLAPAAARRGALEARADRAGEDVDVGVARRRRRAARRATPG